MIPSKSVMNFIKPRHPRRKHGSGMVFLLSVFPPCQSLRILHIPLHKHTSTTALLRAFVSVDFDLVNGKTTQFQIFLDQFTNFLKSARIFPCFEASQDVPTFCFVTLAHVGMTPSFFLH